jgi:hypothetical protein
VFRQFRRVLGQRPRMHPLQRARDVLVQPDSSRRQDLVVQRLLEERVTEPIGDCCTQDVVLLHKRRADCLFKSTLQLFLGASIHAP